MVLGRTTEGQEPSTNFSISGVMFHVEHLLSALRRAFHVKHTSAARGAPAQSATLCPVVDLIVWAPPTCPPADAGAIEARTEPPPRALGPAGPLSLGDGAGTDNLSSWAAGHGHLRHRAKVRPRGRSRPWWYEAFAVGPSVRSRADHGRANALRSFVASAHHRPNGPTSASTRTSSPCALLVHPTSPPLAASPSRAIARPVREHPRPLRPPGHALPSRRSVSTRTAEPTPPAGGRRCRGSGIRNALLPRWRATRHRRVAVSEPHCGAGTDPSAASRGSDRRSRPPASGRAVASASSKEGRRGCRGDAWSAASHQPRPRATVVGAAASFGSRAVRNWCPGQGATGSRRGMRPSGRSRTATCTSPLATPSRLWSSMAMAGTTRGQIRVPSTPTHPARPSPPVGARAGRLRTREPAPDPAGTDRLDRNSRIAQPANDVSVRAHGHRATRATTLTLRRDAPVPHAAFAPGEGPRAAGGRASMALLVQVTDARPERKGRGALQRSPARAVARDRSRLPRPRPSARRARTQHARNAPTARRVQGAVRHDPANRWPR